MLGRCRGSVIDGGPTSTHQRLTASCLPCHYVVLCKSYQQLQDAKSMPVQRCSNVIDCGPTPNQHRSNLLCPLIPTYENIESRSLANPRPRLNAAPLLDQRLGRRPNNKTTSVRCPHLPDKCRPLQAKCWPSVYDAGPTPRRHRPRAPRSQWAYQCCYTLKVKWITQTQY